MDQLYNIINKINKLSCPVCKRKYLPSEIRLKNISGLLLVIQAVCANNHLAIFISDFSGLINKKITEKDILNLRKTLKKFNGDFASLWKN